jgi:hypothetical protein
MTLHDNLRETDQEFLGVWEEHWHERAALAWKVERYRAWLRSQGFSREEAAERAVRLLAAAPAVLPHQQPASSPTVH